MEKTISADELTRDEAAERLRAVADELEGDGPASIRTGNKTVELNPSASIAYEIGVRERSSILRGSRETITIKMDWKPSSASEEPE